jgi:hypothetical protein
MERVEAEIDRLRRRRRLEKILVALLIASDWRKLIIA